MLEVGWSEILVIAIILIIVVGPKDLPGMLRTFGRMAGRVRNMANEFKSQFDDALREAELDDVRKGLNEVNKYNPSSALRDAINPIRKLGEDIKSDLKKASDAIEGSNAQPGTPAISPTSTEVAAAESTAVAVKEAPVLPVVQAEPQVPMVREEPKLPEIVEKPKRKRSVKAGASEVVAGEAVATQAEAPGKSRSKKASASGDQVAPAARKSPARSTAKKKTDTAGDA